RPTRGAILGLNCLKLRYDTPIQGLFSGDKPPQPDALGQRAQQEQRGGDPDKLRGFETKQYPFSLDHCQQRHRWSHFSARVVVTDVCRWTRMIPFLCLKHTHETSSLPTTRRVQEVTLSYKSAELLLLLTACTL